MINFDCHHIPDTHDSSGNKLPRKDINPDYAFFICFMKNNSMLFLPFTRKMLCTNTMRLLIATHTNIYFMGSMLDMKTPPNTGYQLYLQSAAPKKVWYMLKNNSHDGYYRVEFFKILDQCIGPSKVEGHDNNSIITIIINSNIEMKRGSWRFEETPFKAWWDQVKKPVSHEYIAPLFHSIPYYSYYDL